jgi:hypothetical protein
MVAGLFWLAALSSQAKADCFANGLNFSLPANQTLDLSQTITGGGCPNGFPVGIAWTGHITSTTAQTRGSSLGSTVFESFTVLRRPNNLTIQPHANASGYAVAVRGQYKGKDAYTIRACGSEYGRKGCVTVNFDVTVQ